MSYNSMNKFRKNTVGAAISRPKCIESEWLVQSTQFRQLAGG